MPKKHRNRLYHKPPPSTHPAPRPTAAPTGVNDRLHHLRRAQAPPAHRRPAAADLIHAPTVHPSLKALLQLPDHPIPRPRASNPLQARRAARNGPAGPAPPRSWLARPAAANQPRPAAAAVARPLPRLDRLPGLALPPARSLLHHTLRALAARWAFHAAYDGAVLATLPVRLKACLLAYVATYAPRPPAPPDLALLFLPPTVHEPATGVDTLTHLDLGGALGTFSARELLALFVGPCPGSISTSSSSAVAAATTAGATVPDAWDADADAAAALPASLLPALTHLSLASPTHTHPWRVLLKLLPHLATVTHLSLAQWPAPSPTPGLTMATADGVQGRLDAGASNMYSVAEGDWSAAEGLLRRVARGLLCLRWLDLEGCTWVRALGEVGEWAGAWRRVETVRVGVRAEWLKAEEGDDGRDGGGDGEDGGIGERGWDVAVERGKWRAKERAKVWEGVERDVVLVERKIAAIRRGIGGKAVRFERV